MKKITLIILCIILLTIITATSFAIYKSTYNGVIQVNCAQVIADIVTEEENVQVINPNNLTMQYNFSINNYITEGQTTTRNQVVCDYYIKIQGLENSLFNDVTLYYIDSNNASTSLTKITEGVFAGYYETNQRLIIDNNTTHNYRLDITFNSNDLDNITTAVNINIGYKQFIEDETYVNPPELTEGLIPVVWDEENSVWKKTSSENLDWYNYEQKKWANVVTALNNYTDGTNNNLSYSEAPNGTTIPYSDITTMFVWIPRFVYRINEEYYHREISQNQNLTDPPVEIHFTKTESTGGDEWDENIIVVNSGIEAGDCVNSWTTNETFQFGNTYLNGFWVAKFQANISDSTETLYITPATIVKTNIKIDTAFNYCRKMETKSVYGWRTASGLRK
ncbi:MAG: hypothetical protein Q4G09_06380 [Clostridia bacterium]|nr:hypothetical protein [Clostridia bacterium]